MEQKKKLVPDSFGGKFIRSVPEDFKEVVEIGGDEGGDDRHQSQEVEESADQQDEVIFVLK